MIFVYAWVEDGQTTSRCSLKKIIKVSNFLINYFIQKALEKMMQKFMVDMLKFVKSKKNQWTTIEEKHVYFLFSFSQSSIMLHTLTIALIDRKPA